MFNRQEQIPIEKIKKKYDKNEENIINDLSSKTSFCNNDYNSCFNFDIEEIFFFINEEQLILNVSQNFENEKLCKVIKSIYVKIVKSINKNNRKSKSAIKFNNFYFNKYKLVFLSFENINISVLCLFDVIIKNSIIKFFMIYILLSFLNYLYINVDFLSASFVIDKIIYSKIYESFMIMPLIRYFYLLSENIFNKQSIFLEGITYKNFYLIGLDEEKYTQIFSFNNLYDNFYSSNNKKLYKNKIIWNEILFHSNNLKKLYLNNLGKISDKDYQNYFVKIEYKSCIPHMILVIRFLPLLNGVILIHEYEPKELNKNFNNKREFDILFSKDKNIDNNIDLNNERCINVPKIIKERELFIYEFLLCIVDNFQLFYEAKINCYFSEEILRIFVDIVEKSDLNSSFNINYIISKILYYLYNEYLSINNSNTINDCNNENENKLKSKKELIISNNKFINKINDQKHEIVNNMQWDYSNYYHNKNLFNMTKKYYLLILFKPTYNISRFNKLFLEENDYSSSKYEYINIDLKKGMHKSINVTMKFSNMYDKSDFLFLEKNNGQNLNLSNLLTKPISNYGGPLYFDYQSTNNMSHEYDNSNSIQSESTKKSLFNLKSFSIKK